MSKRARTTTVLSSSRWLAYAAAGAATALGAAQLAEGEIHYSGQIRERISNPDGYDHATLPLSHDASLYFRAYSYAAVPSYNFAGVGVLADVSHQVRAHRSRYRQASNLSLEQRVSSGYFADAPRSAANIIGPYGSGFFKRGGVGFVGFKFNTGGGPQYGWVRIRTRSFPRSGFDVVDYAWGDPGDSITTGQRRSSGSTEVAVPASGSLGFLAVGAPALQAWREGRAEKTNRP